MNHQLVKRFYEADKYYVVMRVDGILFAESPEEQGLDETDPQETLIRLFIDESEVNAYSDYVSVVHEEVKVISTTLKDLWFLIEDAENLSMTVDKCPLRIAFTELDADGWPVDNDSIYSAFMIPS